MLTHEPTTVDAARGLLWTIPQIAERDRVSKQAVSKAVKGLIEKHKLSHQKDGRGRVAAVNIAEYDHLRGFFSDPSRSQAPKPAEIPTLESQSTSRDEADRQSAWLVAERRRIELGEMKGDLIRKDRVIEAAVACADAFRATVNLQSHADDLAAAVARDGVRGLRVMLKTIETNILSRAADTFAALSLATPMADTQEDTAAA